MGRKPDPCLCCGLDTRREGDEVMGAHQLMCGCGRHFCIACTKNIYQYGTFTTCPVCDRPLIGIPAPSVAADATESEKTPP